MGKKDVSIATVFPPEPVSSVRSMSEIVDAELASRDAQLTLISAFAALALVLGAVGLYGVLSYTVTQHTNEIGLRMALGAKQKVVVTSAVRSAVTTAFVGVVIWLVAAFAVARGVETFSAAQAVVVVGASSPFYRVSAADPVTAAVVVCTLLLTAVLAAFVPARRAASVSPATALRADG